MEPSPLTTTVGDDLHVGLVADTHGGIVRWADVQPTIEPLLRGVDLIVHCGDVGTEDVLDSLATIAPVLALRGGDAPPAREPDLVDGTRVLESPSLRIGITFSLTDEPVGVTIDDGLAFPVVAPGDLGDLLFGGPVDAVVFGGTHQALTALADGILFVNPGSPTLSDRVTVGRLRLAGRVVEAQILDVT